ncbi:MAG: hypothetical protein WA882_17515, partial [Geitlerinemataceae cyanobacterium]
MLATTSQKSIENVNVSFDRPIKFQFSDATFKENPNVKFSVYGKGGIGKSTTSCNISVALAR